MQILSPLRSVGIGPNTDLHLVRLIWRSEGIDEWMFEDVTALAMPYNP